MRSLGDRMIEQLLVWMLKVTLGAASSAWAFVVVEGRAWAAVLALPPITLAAYMLARHSGRLRGKRGEGGP